MADGSAGERIRVPLGMSLPRLLAQSGYRVHTSAPARRSLKLFDTGDRRLAAAGAELSLHQRDGWRWRRDTLGHPKLTSREWTAPPEAPLQQLMDWTRAYRRGRPLAARASVAVHRRNHEVGDAGSAPLLTMVEERIDDNAGARPRPRLRRVSVVETDDSMAAAVAVAVIQGAALDDAATLALLRPASVRVPRLQLPAAESVGARDLFIRSSTLSLIQWLYFDCELSGGSPDALRKVRVALRRLRSDLQTFAPVLDRPWADALREQLGHMATRLGVVRDAEVLNDRLMELVAQLLRPDEQAAQPLLDAAAGQLSAARAELLEELARDEYLAVLDDAAAAVTRPRWADGTDDLAVTRLARRPWRRLREHVAALDDNPDDLQLHRMRILAKRARYAADACVPAVGGAAATSAAQLADLQTALGDQHDAVVTREWLHRQAVATPDLSFVSGQLAALELVRLGEVSRRWRKAWAIASRRQDWRWLRS